MISRAISRAGCAILLSIGLWSQHVQTKPRECSNECLVSLKGLQPEYSRDTTSNLVVRNGSRYDLAVNLALEGLEDGTWIEVAGSISEPKYSFSKMLKLVALKKGESVKVSFDPCETPILIKKDNALQKSRAPVL